MVGSPLYEVEIILLNHLINGGNLVDLKSGFLNKRLGNPNDMFKNAVRKFRQGRAGFEDRLPEGDCDYDLDFFKRKPVEAKALIERHQLAWELAYKTFWDVRCGLITESK